MIKIENDAIEIVIVLVFFAIMVKMI